MTNSSSSIRILVALHEIRKFTNIAIIPENNWNRTNREMQNVEPFKQRKQSRISEKSSHPKNRVSLRVERTCLLDGSRAWPGMLTWNQTTLACQPVSGRLSLEERDTCRTLGRVPQKWSRTSARHYTWTGDILWQFPGRPSIEGSGALESRFESSHRDGIVRLQLDDITWHVNDPQKRNRISPVSGIPQAESRPLCRATHRRCLSEWQSEKRITGTRGTVFPLSTRSFFDSVDLLGRRGEARIVSRDLIL